MATLSLRERASLINQENDLHGAKSVTAHHIWDYYKRHKISYKVMKVRTAYRRKESEKKDEEDMEKKVYLKLLADGLVD